MSKSTKKLLGIVVIVILILAIVWLVYENIKPQPTSVNVTNELPDENKGIDNIINDVRYLFLHLMDIKILFHSG